MALKIYQRFGLRRDNNLGDLNNPTLGLTNILNDVESGKAFEAKDIGVIKGLYVQGLDTGTFLEVAGSAEQTTDSGGQTSPTTPYYTYHNKLDLSIIYGGTPRIFGGDGPNAKYYDFTQVANPIPSDPTINAGMWVSGTEPFAEDQFWELGDFSWDRKLHENSANVGGGIEWEGYYIPTDTGVHQFRVSSTGCWTLDFQKESYSNAFQPNTDWDTTSGGAYNAQKTDTHNTVYKNYAFIRPEVDIVCTRIDDEKVQIVSNANYNQVAIGMTCINSTYIDGGADGTKISEMNTSTGVFTLSTENNAYPAGTSSWSNQTLKFVQDATQGTNNTYPIDYSLVKGVPYRFKLRYFIPTYWDASRSDRYLNIDLISPTSSSDLLSYRHLYSLNYDFSDSAKGSFNKFIDNSILFGGGTTGGLTKDLYKSIKTDKKIDGRYDPINLTLTNDYSSSNANGKNWPYKKIEVSTFTVNSLTKDSNTIEVDITSGMEIGNYVYDHSWAAAGATGTKSIEEGTRISEVVSNGSIILSKPILNNSGTTIIKVIEHRGHIKRIVANSNTNTTTLTLQGTSTTDSGTVNVLKKKMIVVGSNLPINTQVTIRPTTATALALTAPPSSSLNNQPYYVYDYQGLINDSMVAFCEPGGNATQNNCLTVESLIPVDTTSITFSTSGVSQTTWNAIPSGANTNRVLGYYFAPNTYITSKTNGTGSVRGTINLSAATVKQIKEGNNFTVTSDTGSEDKSLCCPPKDTAPPFASTDDGMVTLDNPDIPNNGFETLDVLSGNVVFDNIRATLKSDQILEPNTVAYNDLLDQVLDKRLKFKAGDNMTYSMFMST